MVMMNCFGEMVNRQKGVRPFLLQGPMPQGSTLAHNGHTASKFWNCTSWVYWMKLCRGDEYESLIHKSSVLSVLKYSLPTTFYKIIVNFTMVWKH